ncbi:MAG: sulfotransferase [Myxococcales bacterium]|nr:sulfotransferase [Myxococcales bacterium]MCB9628693.1 sulfotransferase [Sandaracinaceae bacterium]
MYPNPSPSPHAHDALDSHPARPSLRAVEQASAESVRDVLPRGRGNLVLQAGAVGRLVALTWQRFSLRRALAMAIYTPLFFGLFAFNYVCNALDDVAFPTWRRTRVHKPVFIFANPRSGTTLLHRLLSLDEARFCTVKLYQTVFGSVVFYKLLAAIRWVDQRVFFGLIRLLTVDLGNWLFFKSRWEDIHELGFDKPEEDECTFVYAMHTPTTMLLSPFPEQLRDLAWLDTRPRAERERLMDYYDGTLRRILFSSGKGRRFLDKNVFFSPRIKTMAARFPDATFVYLVRHPYDGLGSFLSMFYAAWKTHSPDIQKDSPEAKALARFGMDYLRYALELQRELPADRFVVIRYDELVADPKGTVEALYERLGEPMDAAFAEKLVAATSKQREHSSKHEYSLEEYGLTEAEVYAELRDVFDAYGFQP